MKVSLGSPPGTVGGSGSTAPVGSASPSFVMTTAQSARHARQTERKKDGRDTPALRTDL
jgi:hypothetical protein